jgi:hypothetical protein
LFAIVGNAAEHWVAVLAGYRNEMHLAVTITLGGRLLKDVLETSLTAGLSRVTLVSNGLASMPEGGGELTQLNPNG